MAWRLNFSKGIKCGLEMRGCESCSSHNSKCKPAMLYIFAVIFIIAWLLGLVSDYTMGGFIHILLVAAIVMILVRLIQGKKLWR